MRRRSVLTLLVALAAPAVAIAQPMFESGSTGVLGALAPAQDVTLDLPEDGVLHYTTIDIPAGVTVTFSRNAMDTPVYLLASGDVTIAGTIDVSGKKATTADRWWVTKLGGVAGPGGGDGASIRIGVDFNWSASGMGLGPGQPGVSGQGSPYGGAGGGAGPTRSGFGTASRGGTAWADSSWWLAAGGSGGGSTWQADTAAGGGGGVITIASSGTIALTGAVLARGGDGWGNSGSGGGGMVRLAAEVITGGGSVNASAGGGGCDESGVWNAGCGGPGAIYVEAFDISGAITTASSPGPLFGEPTKAVPYPAAKRPTLAITAVNGQPAVFGNPNLGVLGDPKMVLPVGQTVSVKVDATWVPPGTQVVVAVNSLGGGRATYTGDLIGTLAAASVTIDVPIPANKQAGALEAWIVQLPLPTL